MRYTIMHKNDPQTEAGQPPKVLTSACHLGAERARQLFEETYDDYRRRVGVLYR